MINFNKREADCAQIKEEVKKIPCKHCGNIDWKEENDLLELYDYSLYNYSLDFVLSCNKCRKLNKNQQIRDQLMEVTFGSDDPLNYYISQKRRWSEEEFNIGNPINNLDNNSETSTEISSETKDE